MVSSGCAKKGGRRQCTYVVSHTEVTRSLPEPRAFLREAPVCKKLTPKLVPIRPKKIPQHVGGMLWHDVKFHDFQACFGFTGIKKPSFSIFPAEPRLPDVWISFPFLAWNLEIYPRTHMWFFNQVWCTGACACISNLNYAHKGDTFPLGTTSLLVSCSGLWGVCVQTFVKHANFFYHIILVAWHYIKQGFMFFWSFSNFWELKCHGTPCMCPCRETNMFKNSF